MFCPGENGEFARFRFCLMLIHTSVKIKLRKSRNKVCSLLGKELLFVLQFCTILQMDEEMLSYRIRESVTEYFLARLMKFS